MPIKSSKLGPGRLTLGAVGTTQEFASQLRSCKLEPSVDTSDPIPVLSGEELPGDDTLTYVLSGSILDDYTMTGLAVWSKTNAGKTLPFEFVPNTADKLMAKGNVVVQPIAIGGDVKERNENDFEFRGVGDWTYSATA
ncbi:hypothetical protein [Arthrobacter woluwensis]|uniref:hypothetical protein n=1 Tax=Arthrobacter woluwensis TaxID=156980 RepID=UPI001AAF0B5B|nr:hypothetical protein [Arthrobacter woluwensis]QTF71763.1 hypothetical protein G8758_06920 [Arthrobacter woluwensis]